MAKANLYITAPDWAAPQKVLLSSANAYAKADTLVGNVTYTTGSANISGINTKFTTQLKSGDVIVQGLTNNTYQNVSIIVSVLSDTLATMSKAATGNVANATIEKADYFAVTTAYGWSKAKLLRGVVTTNAANTIVNGVDTYFTLDLVKGDRVAIMNNEVRATGVVANVDSNTKITLAAAANIVSNASILKVEEVLYSFSNLDTRTDPTK